MSGSGADPAPTVVPFGDRALLVDTADTAAAHALAAVLDGRIATGAAPDGIEEVVVGFASVLVVLASSGPDLGAGAAWVAESTTGPGAPRSGGRRPRTHVLPVLFDGADLAEVAAALELSVDHVVDQLVSARLEVAFVGFAPGFPYLTGLPAGLAALPRRPSPRTSVPAGSVAVAGGFASVYPRATPGGWHLLGRTAESLFDPDVPPHSRVAPGDRVRFTATDAPTCPNLRPVIARPPLVAVGTLPRGPRARPRHHRAGRRASRAAPISACPRPARPTPAPWPWPTSWSATRPMRPASSARRRDRPCAWWATGTWPWSGPGTTRSR